MLQVPKAMVDVIKKSCTFENVRGAHDWRDRNDGNGHVSNVMESLVQARKAEWYVWKVLSHRANVKNLSTPNFDRDQRAAADLYFDDSTGKRWHVEVKSCDAKKRDRNGYQFQIRRRRKGKLQVVDPFIRTGGEEGGDTLFYCVVVSGDRCKADTVFGMPRKHLVCSPPNRVDLKELKLAIHPRLNNPCYNVYF